MNTRLALFENYHSDFVWYYQMSITILTLFDITKCLDSIHVAIFFYNQYLSSRHLLYYKTSVTSDFYVKSLVTDVCQQRFIRNIASDRRLSIATPFFIIFEKLAKKTIQGTLHKNSVKIYTIKKVLLYGKMYNENGWWPITMAQVTSDPWEGAVFYPRALIWIILIKNY